MTTAATMQTLPIWIWLLFTIFLVGVITLVYSQGNWRTTLSFVGITLAVALAIVGIDVWNNYLATHFIGQFDSLGIPFRKAGPGWDILWEAWPLWLIPMCLMTALAFSIDWILRRYLATKPEPVITEQAQLQPEEKPKEIKQPLQNITRQIELETLKRELALVQEKLGETIEIAETQLDKKQQLQATLEQVRENHRKKITELENRIAALMQEKQTTDQQKEQLNALAAQQKEAINQLKTQLEVALKSSPPPEP